MFEDDKPQNKEEISLLEYFANYQNLPDLFDDEEDDLPEFDAKGGDAQWETCAPGLQLSVSRGVVLDYRCAPELRGVDLTDDETGTSVMSRCKSLAGEAFKGCAALGSVTLTRKDLMVGPGCFSQCKNLKRVTFGMLHELTLLRMFTGCTNLESVTLPEGLERITMVAFEGCRSLRKINLPDTVKEIEDGAFFGCESLEEVVLPAQLVSLGEDAFTNCTALRNLRLPDSLRELGDNAFTNCVSLEEIRVPEGVTEIPFGTFCGCTGLKHVVLPASVRKVSPYAFYRCTALETVEHPNVDRFAPALCGTTFWKKRHPNYIHRPRVPMELLNHIGGAVDGSVLSIRGYTGFFADRSYRIFSTRYPDVWEVWEPHINEEGKEGPSGNYYLMDGNLKPIDGVEPMLNVTLEFVMQHHDEWEHQKRIACLEIVEKLLLG